ncbi:MAG TPA: prepilin-type N-terminal cleavage/methylation domain-containing protein [Porticoccus sp.]|nr:prepilin-type N-terminal cleavage/methylation domain-containing protein [Porticoccus sp.]
MDFFNRKKGFTLVELLITIALVAVISALAVPSFQTLIKKSRTSVEAQRVLTTLYYARMEAIKRNSLVSLCPSSDGLACNPDLSWMDGWIVFSDRGKRGELDHDMDRVIRVGDPAQNGYLLYTTKHHKWFGYQSDGNSVGSSGSGNTSFIICSPDGGIEGRRVVVSITGRPRVATGIGDRVCDGG